MPSHIAFQPTALLLNEYAAILPIAEINSSLHRPHRIATWERWRNSVPEDFRFSVKLPKQVTHVRELIERKISLPPKFEASRLHASDLQQTIGPVTAPPR